MSGNAPHAFASFRGLAAFAGLLPLISILAFACGSEEEVESGNGAANLSPTPIPTTTAAPATNTPAPTVVGGSTMPGGTQEWLSYSEAPELFFVSYPSDWRLETFPGEPQIRLASFDLTEWNGIFPKGGALLDIARVPKDQLDAKSGQATDGVLAGEPAWIVERASSPPDGGDATWKYQYWVGAVRGDYGYILAGYFADEQPDKTILLQIIETFEFGK